MTFIAAFSDAHGYLPPIEEIPECDYLINAGDTSPVWLEHDIFTQCLWFAQVYKPWEDELLNSGRVGKIIMIGGNHDFLMEQKDFRMWWLNYFNTKYLQDEMYYGDLLIYGTPWVPNLHRWAFYGDHNKLTNVFANVPKEIDVLVTHGPPEDINDGIATRNYYEHVGSKEFARSMECKPKEDRPKINIHGHIHEGYGLTNKFGVDFYNVSRCTRDYEPTNEVVLIEV